MNNVEFGTCFPSQSEQVLRSRLGLVFALCLTFLRNVGWWQTTLKKRQWIPGQKRLGIDPRATYFSVTTEDSPSGSRAVATRRRIFRRYRIFYSSPQFRRRRTEPIDRRLPNSGNNVSNSRRKAWDEGGSVPTSGGTIPSLNFWKIPINSTNLQWTQIRLYSSVSTAPGQRFPDVRKYCKWHLQPRIFGNFLRKAPIRPVVLPSFGRPTDCVNVRSHRFAASVIVQFCKAKKCGNFMDE